MILGQYEIRSRRTRKGMYMGTYEECKELADKLDGKRVYISLQTDVKVNLPKETK